MPGKASRAWLSHPYADSAFAVVFLRHANTPWHALRGSLLDFPGGNITLTVGLSAAPCSWQATAYTHERTTPD